MSAKPQPRNTKSAPKPLKLRDALLRDFLSQPTAPFREGHVLRLARETLTKAGVPHFQDPVGNIVIGVASRAELKNLLSRDPREPLRVFMAHMDHPGFHGKKWLAEDKLEVQWHGGTPVKNLEDYPVWFASREGWAGRGTLTSATLKTSRVAIDRAVLHVETAGLRTRFKKPTELFGGFRFREPVWEAGELLYTKAADDLVGTFTVVSLALDAFAKKAKKSPFLGLLTRAEEVGFIGAIGHLELGWYSKTRRPVLFVSLETSRTLPGAEIGKGPIVRLGDRFTVFRAPELRVFLDVAAQVLPGAHQVRIMDGGSCEASAATVYGLPAIGISIPLGNYHNQCFEGGPDSGGPMGPAPEFVDKRDVAGMIALCQGLLQPGLPWSEPWKNRRTTFRKSYLKAKPLLSAGIR